MTEVEENNMEELTENELKNYFLKAENAHPHSTTTRTYNQDASTEEEDDDLIEITLSNAKAGIPPQTTVSSSTAPLKAPKSAVVLTAAFNNPLLKPSDLDENTLITNYPIFEYDLEKGEKPWKKPGADISDYFNYGFNEETWKIYCEKQRKLRIETASMRRMLGESSITTHTQAVLPESSDINYMSKNDELIQEFPSVQIPIPPELNLNIAPEMASSIAELVANQLGLPPSFLSQLPSYNDLVSAGMAVPPNLLASFIPSVDSYPQENHVIIQDVINQRPSPKKEKKRHRSRSKEKRIVKSSRSKLDEDIGRSRRERSREKDRYRSRRSVSRDRKYR